MRGRRCPGRRRLLLIGQGSVKLGIRKKKGFEEIGRTHLLIAQRAVREDTIRIGRFVSSPSDALCLEVPVEALDDIPSAMLRRLAQIRAFKVVDLDL